MTKKTKASKTQSTQASDKESEPKIKRPRGRPRKNATLSDVSPSKGKKVTQGGKKSAVSKSEKKVPVSRGRKPKVAVEVDSEVEIKVREIVKKTRSKTPSTEEKKESSTFNLGDVRAIIQKRKAETASSKPKKKKKVKETEVELVPSKEEPKKTGKSVKVKKLQTASVDDILGVGLSVGPTRPIRDAKKVPKEWEVYYNDLMNLRHSLKGALGQRSNETLGASARESSGELSINSADSGSESFNRDVALSMVATEQEALEEIEDAIDRIFDGTFGICQETEKPIKKSRLKVVPFTRFSLEGQTLYEKRNRRERDAGGGIFATISDSTLGDDS